MMKRMRRFGMLLCMTAAVCSTASGCGGGSTSGISSAGDRQGPSAVVTITDYAGVRIPNATVVMGDSSGAMKDFGDTDANGQITFANAPENCTITAVSGCLRSGQTTTTYSVRVQYDVNGSVVLSLDHCESGLIVLPPPPPTDSSPLGTITVNVTNIPANVAHYQMTFGRQGVLGLGNVVTATNGHH